MLQEAPSGEYSFSPKSSGLRETEPSSLKKQGMPMSPISLEWLKTGSLSRSAKNSFDDSEAFIVLYLLMDVRAIRARFHSEYLYHDHEFTKILLNITADRKESGHS